MHFSVPPHILMCTVAKPCPSTMLCLCLINVCILSWTLLKIKKQISNWNNCKKVKWSSLLGGILGWLKAESEMVWLPSFSCLLEFSAHQKQPSCCYGCRTLQWSLFSWQQIVFTRWVHRTSLLFFCFSFSTRKFWVTLGVKFYTYKKIGDDKVVVPKTIHFFLQETLWTMYHPKKIRECKWKS